MGDLQYIAVLTVALATLGAALLFYRRRHPTPDELERRRRLDVNTRGRMRDAVVIDVHGTVLQYTYEVSGVAYTATQDLRGLAGVPEDPARLLGVGTVKYLPKHPANSIMVCETWSGLRKGPQGTPTDHIQKASDG